MKTKFNLDREPLDTSYIQSRQDFDKVINGYRAMKPPIWKNPWFYGPIGIASLAILVTLTFQNKFFANDNNSTLNNSLQKSQNQFPDDTPCIKPLSKTANIDFEIHPIDPAKGGTIITQNGSQLKIAPKSLITNGKDQVIIKVREFPDQSSALLAGIPMDYGKVSAFESGGMIEIRGEQNGQSIAIDSKKPIQVDMSLHKSGKDFGFWALNDQSGEWTDHPCKFTEGKAVTNIPTQKPKSEVPQIKAVQEEIEICEKNIHLVQNQEKDQTLIPEKNARKLVVDFYAKEFPELSGYQDVEFEYLLPENRTLENTAKFEKSIRYASTQTWNNMSVAKKGTDYIVTFKNMRETYSVPVRPVLKGASLNQLEKKLAEAEKNRQEKLNELEKEKATLLKREKDLKFKFEKNVNDMKSELSTYVSPAQSGTNEKGQSLNSVRGASSNFSTTRGNFLTSGFGVFNCDKPVPYPPEFNVPVICVNESGQRIEAAGIYIFDQKKKTRFSYGEISGRKIDQVAWNNHQTALILIDMEGNLYYKKEINKDPLQNHKVTLTRISRKSVCLEEIQKILDENTVTA